VSSEGCETDFREIPNHSEQMAERSDDDLSTLYDIAYQVYDFANGDNYKQG